MAIINLLMLRCTPKACLEARSAPILRANLPLVGR